MKLEKNFLEQYKGRQPEWGPVGYITYKRTYARPLENGETEEYWQTCQRVIEGIFNILEEHHKKENLTWNEQEQQEKAKKMYDLMWNFKFTPPGRGLWAMGTDTVEKKGIGVLLNCFFVSTKKLKEDYPDPFLFMMDMSALGGGVGFDTRGEGQITIVTPEITETPFIVKDSRNGWLELLEMLLNAYVGKNKLYKNIDYSNVRPTGAPIKGGGTASGPEPLKKMYNNIKDILQKRINNTLSSGDIVDIMNHIGTCIVAGGSRRSAQLSLGFPEDQEYLDLKNPDVNQEALLSHRWASNNSVVATVGMDYKNVSEYTMKNGEPGYIWIDNARKYNRMGETHQQDINVQGTNPCGEITLESYEGCNIVETYIAKHDTLEEWLETLPYAYLYAKTVTLIDCHRQKTEHVMKKNRRIGISITGIVQAFEKFGRRNVFDAMNKGYEIIDELDEKTSLKLKIPMSIKKSTVKPSGTVSLLAGVTPGVHYPVSKYYYRTIRIQKDSSLLKELEEAGYRVEEDVYSDNTMVVYFPIKEKHFDRSAEQVSIWEQLENVAQIQKYWADNAVSVTVTFSPEEADDIPRALELYESRLKSVSFLPRIEHGYKQAPYIPITKEDYEKSSASIKPTRFSGATHEKEDLGCETDVCEIKSFVTKQ